MAAKWLHKKTEEDNLDHFAGYFLDKKIAACHLIGRLMSCLVGTGAFISWSVLALFHPVGQENLPLLPGWSVLALFHHLAANCLDQEEEDVLVLSVGLRGQVCKQPSFKQNFINTNKAFAVPDFSLEVSGF